MQEQLYTKQGKPRKGFTQSCKAWGDAAWWYLAFEVGGRWSTEAAQFLRSLARTKARTVPAQLRHATVTALIARWSASLTHAAMHAYAASLLSMPPSSAITGEEDSSLGAALGPTPRSFNNSKSLAGPIASPTLDFLCGLPFLAFGFLCEWPRSLPFSETRCRKRCVRKKNHSSSVCRFYQLA